MSTPLPYTTLFRSLTEPQSGSDASAMHTRATKNANGEWVINGKKSWITSGPVARYIVLFAITTPGIGAKGVSAFIVDTHLPGFHAGKTEPKLGIRDSATCEIELTDYVLPKANLLGERWEEPTFKSSQLRPIRLAVFCLKKKKQ